MFIIGLSIVSLVLPLTIITAAVCLYIDIPIQIVAIMSIPAVILMLIGIILMIIAWNNRKNQNELIARNNKNKQKYCNTCNINVADSCSSCPICGRLMK